MSRPKHLKDPIRVNYVIERRQDEELKKLSLKTGKNVSELLRIAIDSFLNTEEKEQRIERTVPKTIEDTIKVLNLFIAKIENGEAEMDKEGKVTNIDLSRYDLIPLIGPQWWKVSSVMSMVVSVLITKGYDTLCEEQTRMKETDQNRFKKEKCGFYFFIPSGIKKEEIKRIIEDVIKDVKEAGYIRKSEQND